MRKIAILSGSALALAVAVIAVWLRAMGKSEAPGLFGPGALLADINLTLEILLVLGLTFGMFLARRGNIEAHRLNQTTWVLVNVALVASIMAPSLKNAKLKSLADLTQPSISLPWLHALIGALTIASGLWLVLQMNDVLPARWHIRGWKNLMRFTLAGYWTVAVLGVVIYYRWYLT